jgi:hypothetical protein
VIVERAGTSSTKVSDVIPFENHCGISSDPHLQRLGVAANVVDLKGTATSADDAEQNILAYLQRSHMHFESAIEVSQVNIHTT